MSLSSCLPRFRCAVLSVVKHAYVPRGVAAHPRFELSVVADDPDRPDWAHERNQGFADEHHIPYVRDVERAIREFGVQVAVVSSEAERHCELSVRAANAGLHIVQDKPLSNRLSECDRLVEAVERNGVKFLMWNRNCLPALLQARDIVHSGRLGQLRAIHVDFYFAKDAGPPKGTRKPGEPPIDWLERQLEAHADGSDGGVGREPMGELAIEGIYPLAYMRFLTGAAVRRVYARTAAFFHQANVGQGPPLAEHHSPHVGFHIVKYRKAEWGARRVVAAGHWLAFSRPVLVLCGLSLNEAGHRQHLPAGSMVAIARLSNRDCLSFLPCVSFQAGADPAERYSADKASIVRRGTPRTPTQPRGRDARYGGVICWNFTLAQRSRPVSSRFARKWEIPVRCISSREY